jgi:hypothetical protein
MDYWEKKIAAASVTNPAETLRKDKDLFRKVKKDNDQLREENRKLVKNNDTLVKLVEFMEEKIKGLRVDMKENYVYSYEHGGWLEKGALDKGRIELAPESLNVDSINNQLAEILRMIEKHKMRDK